MKNKKVLISGAFILFGFIALVGVTRAWTAPSAAPPGGSPVINYSGGNVGIGTASPVGKLDVSYVGGTSNFGSTAGGNNLLWVRSTGGSAGIWAGGSMGLLSTGEIRLIPNQTYGTPNYNPAVTVTTGGNVGIGTSGPGAKLEVAGQVKITGGTPGAGKVLTSDAAGLASWQTATTQAFPVGSVFLSVVSTNPATLLGYGTWTQIAQGRALVGQDPGDADWDAPEETRGAKTHTLTVAETPSHNHSQDAHSHTPYINSEENGGYTRIDGSGPGGTLVPNGSMTPAQPYIYPAGGGGAHNNIQPSFVIYVWKRTL